MRPSGVSHTGSSSPGVTNRSTPRNGRCDFRYVPTSPSGPMKTAALWRTSPLALEQAARDVRAEPPAGVLERLARRAGDLFGIRHRLVDAFEHVARNRALRQHEQRRARPGCLHQAFQTSFEVALLLSELRLDLGDCDAHRHSSSSHGTLTYPDRNGWASPDSGSNVCRQTQPVSFVSTWMETDVSSDVVRTRWMSSRGGMSA